MKLYYTSSVCSLAVRIIIHELDIRCEYEAVDLKTKLTETGTHYLEINPKGSVPVLSLNDREFLTENAVILQYLADKFNANQLLPSVGDMQRYRVLEWLNFATTDLHRYSAPLFWSKISDDVKASVFTPILSNKLSVVNLHLQDRKFLMGDQLTLGDSYVFVILIWLAKLEMKMTAWPNLCRYFEDMKARATVQQALKEEGLSELTLML